MTCPTCSRSMVQKAAFLHMHWVCEPCERGEPKPGEWTGWIHLGETELKLLKGGALLYGFAFKDTNDAVSNSIDGRFVMAVEFTEEPAWKPQIISKRFVAACKVRANGDGLVASNDPEGF